MTELEENKKHLNISEKHKFFLWTPAKTGTHHTVSVFENFYCEYQVSNFERTEIFNNSKSPKPHHFLHLFSKHENYKLICTARNPLHRIYSAFFHLQEGSPKNNINTKEFIKFFVEMNYANDPPFLNGINFLTRKPDYFLRLENLYQDYEKIPFVVESDFYKSGKLKQMCEEKINSHLNPNYNIKDFYTSDMIDFLYTKYKKYFDLLDYEPII